MRRLRRSHVPRAAALLLLVVGSSRTTGIAAPATAALATDRVHQRPSPAPTVLQPPSVLFAPLYQAVEMEHVFPDQKTFADAIPDEEPGAIMIEYRRQSMEPNFDLKVFVAAHFTEPVRKTASLKPRADEHVVDYIDSMWTVLQRQPDDASTRSSLLPLAFPYVVPGGRFSEIYYWDSYFTMLGLERSGRPDLAADMMRNMASLIDRYGHIPNGNRTYYLSRSEPPFFACMIDLIASRDGARAYLAYLPELQREYDYWMDGAETLEPGQQHRHVVRLADGTVLNRYWDDRDVPRDESYAEDVETARHADRPAAEIYRDLRAGSESGWDFSSRWLGDGHSMTSIRTTQILPVDLNSLLAHMEQTLSHGYALRGDRMQAALYARRADTRIAAIRRLMWNPQAAMFTDYVWTSDTLSPAISAATVVPLFLGLATPGQGRQVADSLRAKLLRPGGLATSLEQNGQQWDSPNGWAPLQWMAVVGLRVYGQNALAETIAGRWIEREIAAYAQSGVLLEKYNVRSASVPASGGGAGGEYPLQVGFGWTNGVLINLMQLYPQSARRSLATHPDAAATPG